MERVEKVMRPRKRRTYKHALPANFCHICWRNVKSVDHLVCGNIARRECLKVTCQKCFDLHGWDWELAKREAANWRCTHCRAICPERAQCYVYHRSNVRRQQTAKQKRQKAMRKTLVEAETKNAAPEDPKSPMSFSEVVAAVLGTPISDWEFDDIKGTPNPLDDNSLVTSSTDTFSFNWMDV